MNYANSLGCLYELWISSYLCMCKKYSICFTTQSGGLVFLPPYKAQVENATWTI